MEHERLVDALHVLCSLSGPTGSEGVVVEEMARRWQVPCERDRVGNLLVKIGGEGPRTLIHAHADQVGYVVVSVTDHGFLMLDTAQGVRGVAPERRWPIGQGARVGTRKGEWVSGIFAAASGHVTRRESAENQELTWDKFWIDLGLESRQQAEHAGVYVGGPVVFEPTVRRLGAHRISGCAMDDRVGLCVLDGLLVALRERLDDLTCELWFAVTTQEEGGMHGAFALGHAERFERAIGLEVGLVGDLPGVSESDHPGRLGGGPMIVHKDGVVTYDRTLSRLIYGAGATSGAKTQDVAFAHYGSDGMGFIDTGSPAALVAVPTRYTHTGFEMVDMRDVKATIDLLAAVVTHQLPVDMSS